MLLEALQQVVKCAHLDTCDAILMETVFETVLYMSSGVVTNGADPGLCGHGCNKGRPEQHFYRLGEVNAG